MYLCLVAEPGLGLLEHGRKLFVLHAELPNLGLLGTFGLKGLWTAADVAGWAHTLSGHLVEDGAWYGAHRMTAVCLTPAVLALAAAVLFLELTGTVSGAWKRILAQRATLVTGFSDGARDALTSSTLTIEADSAGTTVGADLAIDSILRAIVLASVTEEASLASAGCLASRENTLALERACGTNLIGGALDVTSRTLEAILTGADGFAALGSTLTVSAAGLASILESWASETTVSSDEAFEAGVAFGTDWVGDIWDETTGTMTRAALLVAMDTRAGKLA